jgi:MFS family permease
VSDTTKGRPEYRWVVLACSTLILAIVMGQLVNGLSVYFITLETTEGWSRADIALINSSGLIGLALGSLCMGFVADAYGIRRVAIVGIVATGLGTLAASRATELWHLYTLFFIAGALGGGAIAGPIMALVGSWFTRGAGLAIGIASGGQALGQGGMPFTGAFLIEAMGWRGAMAAQGILTLAVLLPLALLLRDPESRDGSAALSHETPSGLPNSLITGWISLAVIGCCTCMAVPLMHLVPLIQGKGFSAPEASSVLFWMLIIAIVGRISFGRLADMIGAIPTYMTASAWQTLLVLGFIFITRLDHFYLYAAIYGFGYAGVMTSIFVTVRNLTAPARRATSTGIVLAFAYIGHGLGGWQGGYFYDLTGQYTWSYANAAIAGVFNLILLAALWLTINRRPMAAAA